MRRVENDLARAFPSADITTRTLSMASVIGRNLRGLSVLQFGLVALADAGLSAIGASQGPRNVDVQFIVDRDVLQPTIRALHSRFIEAASLPQTCAA